MSITQPRAGAPAPDEAEHDGGDRLVAGHWVAVGDAGLERLAVAVPGEGDEAGHHLDHGTEADQLGVGARLAEGGHRHDHQVLASGAEHVPAEAQLVEHVGPVVLDDHVDVGHESQEQLPAPVLGQVERQRLLPPVVGVEVVGRVPRLRRPGLGQQRANVVPGRGRLDLPDLRAHLGQAHGGERPRPHHREVEDPDALERRLPHEDSPAPAGATWSSSARTAAVSSPGGVQPAAAAASRARGRVVPAPGRPSRRPPRHRGRRPGRPRHGHHPRTRVRPARARPAGRRGS